MEDVAKELGIQKASLYHWVSSKEDLLYEVLEGALDEVIAGSQAVVQEEGLSFGEKLRRLVTLHCRSTVNHADTMQVFLSEATWLRGQRGRELKGIRADYYRLYEDLFIQAWAAGEIDTDRDRIPVYVNFVFAMMNNLPVWYRVEGPLSVSEIAGVISDLILCQLTRA